MCLIRYPPRRFIRHQMVTHIDMYVHYRIPSILRCIFLRFKISEIGVRLTFDGVKESM
jgi:hypothetical protein